MMVYQISVFLENKPNRLSSVTQALKDGNINLRAAMIAEAGEFGIIRAIVDDPDNAYKLLDENNFTVKKTNVVGVEAADGPGSLSEISKVLGANEINIIYLYAFTLSGKNAALLIFKTDDNQRARQIIKDELGMKIITQRDINTL